MIAERLRDLDSDPNSGDPWDVIQTGRGSGPRPVIRSLVLLALADDGRDALALILEAEGRIAPLLALVF